MVGFCDSDPVSEQPPVRHESLDFSGWTVTVEPPDGIEKWGVVSVEVAVGYDDEESKYPKYLTFQTGVE